MSIKETLKERFVENTNKINSIQRKVRNSNDSNFKYGMVNGNLKELIDERQRIRNEYFNINQ